MKKIFNKLALFLSIVLAFGFGLIGCQSNQTSNVTVNNGTEYVTLSEATTKEQTTQAATQAAEEQTTSEQSTKENVSEPSNQSETKEQTVEATTQSETKEQTVEATTQSENKEQNTAAKDYVVHEFASKKLYDEHYEKHVITQKEFGNITQEEYLKLANDLINAEGDNILTKSNDRADTLYYDTNTNSFAVVRSDGKIRTFFKPSAGIDYFNRQ